MQRGARRFMDKKSMHGKRTGALLARMGIVAGKLRLVKLSSNVHAVHGQRMLWPLCLGPVCLFTNGEVLLYRTIALLAVEQLSTSY